MNVVSVCLSKHLTVLMCGVNALDKGTIHVPGRVA